MIETVGPRVALRETRGAGRAEAIGQGLAVVLTRGRVHARTLHDRRRIAGAAALVAVGRVESTAAADEGAHAERRDQRRDESPEHQVARSMSAAAPMPP